ncbi:MAG: lysophospholipid acyltransferase family protein [Henriciella sp.]|jgi:lysophospholipid acyltransferase (LPLAT)-like uncharacterized protein
MKKLLRHPLMSSALGWLIWAYMGLCARTIRWTVEGQDPARTAWAAEGGIIVAGWHSTILLLPSGWTRLMRHWPGRTGRVAMMVSLSRDGEAVAKAIAHMGLHAVRGSSNNKAKSHDKGGREALREALGLLNGNGVVCVTPDGPRGPAELVQNGPVIMARRARAPLLPYAVVSRPVRRLNSWDRFRIPFPFTRGAIVFGDLLYPDPALDREALRQALQVRLDDAMRRANALLDR